MLLRTKGAAGVTPVARRLVLFVSAQGAGPRMPRTDGPDASGDAFRLGRRGAILRVVLLSLSLPRVFV